MLLVSYNLQKKKIVPKKNRFISPLFIEMSVPRRGNVRSGQVYMCCENQLSFFLRFILLEMTRLSDIFLPF